MLDEAIKGMQRQLARGLLAPLYSFHFIRRRALAMLVKHYRKGDLVLRYRMADHTLFLDPADDVIAARVLLRGDWQRRDLMRVVTLLQRHVPQSRGKLFLDIGANIGTETIYAMLSGHFSGAVTVEPEPGNFELLRQNIAVNGLEEKVHLFNCAVGAKAETGFLMRSHSNKGGHALDPAGKADRAGNGITVDVKPLGQIVEEAGFRAEDAGLVWIDVNGTEADVLKGMGALLDHRVPVVLEHLPTFITAEAARNIHSLLAAHYTKFCRVDDVDEEPAPISKMDPLRATGDFLFF